MITRVTKANTVSGGENVVELRLDYSRDNELWTSYQRNYSTPTNEVYKIVHEHAQKKNTHMCHVLKLTSDL